MPKADEKEKEEEKHMRLKHSFFYTLREDARDEESAGGNLLVRAGMIRKSSSGVYMMMPLGHMALQNIISIIREEMNAIGAQELTMPSLLPEEVYVASGRRAGFGSSMFALKDRFDKPFVLAPTHEELFADAARMAVRSYKNLPLNLYQFQTKFRDEPRPRFGLIRVREFVMKDAYTFDADLEGLDQQYQAVFEAYRRSFDRMGLNYVIVKADTGIMGGLLSEEFQALSEVGEDVLVLEDQSGYAKNLEVAACVLEEEASNEEHLSLNLVETPKAKTIEEVAAFFGKDAKAFVKTLIYEIDGKAYAVCVRGDHEVNETKLQKLLQATEVNLADAALVEEVTGAPVGFAGPVGLKIPVILDQSVTVMANFIVGANQKDHHYEHVNLENFEAAYVADVRKIQEGDLCENKQGRVRFARGIEVGNTFKLGDKYSKAMNLYYTDQNNEQKPVIMGSYGIGPARCMAAIVEQNHTDKGILWPKNIAPIKVAILPVSSKNEEQMALAEALYEDLKQTGLSVLLDDRDERVGVKFADMELIGAYARVTVGRQAGEGLVELKINGEDDVLTLSVDELKAKIQEIFA